MILTTSPSIKDTSSVKFFVVVLSIIIDTLLLLIVSYPNIDAATVYVPGGTFRMKYSPFTSVAAPSFSPLITTFTPTSGSLLALSVTLPDNLPAFPAKLLTDKTTVAAINAAIIILLRRLDEVFMQRTSSVNIMLLIFFYFRTMNYVFPC